MRVARPRTVTLRMAGSVAMVAAAHQLVTGVRGVRGAGADSVNANVDSELRFYAGWYAIAGALMHASATSPDLDRAMRPAIECGWVLAAVARLASARSVGRPSPLFAALAVTEATLAVILLAARPESR